MKINLQSNGIRYSFFFAVIAISCLIIIFRNSNVKKNGIYSITTLIKHSSSHREREVVHQYRYNGTLYEGTYDVPYTESETIIIGTRYFIAFLPNNPEERAILNPVPAWFTLQPPPGGWKTLPTEEQLRTMMKDQAYEK